MQKNKVAILSTKEISESLVATASLYDIELDQIPFITTEETIEPSLEKRIQAISQESHFVVFTSSNAVKSVAHFVAEKPDWKICCIGPKTQTLIAEIFGAESIIATGNNAKELVEIIINNSSIKRMIFFSGNQRRDELPEKLSQHGIELEELVVYKTTETPTLISKVYDGILFFSPSGVKSFFSKNNIDSNTVLFAIGDTTMEAVRQYSDLPVIAAESPSTEKMVCTAIQYFNKIKTS